MAEAISNSSPHLFLYRINALDWMPELFGQIWVPTAVVHELQQGGAKGYDVPNESDYSWMRVLDPESVPSEWLALDLGNGELSVLALGLENKE